MGASLSPLSAFQLLQGGKPFWFFSIESMHWNLCFITVETLSLRVERHCQNALALAQYLEKHPAIALVSL